MGKPYVMRQPFEYDVDNMQQNKNLLKEEVRKHAPIHKLIEGRGEKACTNTQTY